MTMCQETTTIQAYLGLFYRCCIVIGIFILFLAVIKRLTGER